MIAAPPAMADLTKNQSQQIQQNQVIDQLKKSLGAPAFIPMNESTIINNDVFSISSSSSTNSTPLSSRASTPTYESMGPAYGQHVPPMMSMNYTSPTSHGILDDRDAMYVFEGIRNGSMVKFERSLTEEECCKLIKPGAIFVFDETRHFKSWVDGRIWSTVVQNGAFAYFRELTPQPSLNGALVETGFIKKCTSLYVPEEKVFRHLISYFHADTTHLLQRPTFDPSLYLYPSYFGSMGGIEDAQILIDAADYGLLHVARRPPLSFEIDTLIVPGNIFIWDDRMPGSRWWGDGKLWQPTRIEGALVVFREMETVVEGNTSNKIALASTSPPFDSSSTYLSNQPPTTSSNQADLSSITNPHHQSARPLAVVKIIPKTIGLLKKVTTLSSSKSGRIFQIISYCSDTSAPIYQLPSLDRHLQDSIAAVIFIGSNNVRNISNNSIPHPSFTDNGVMGTSVFNHRPRTRSMAIPSNSSQTLVHHFEEAGLSINVANLTNSNNSQNLTGGPHSA